MNTTRMFVRMMLLATLFASAMTFLAGCASNGPRAGEADYTLVYLKTGPNSASHTPEEKQEIFRGHMGNMQRLASEKTLLIAGPFVKPHDASWRGIFLFDVADVDKAQAIAASDPGVSSGEFVTEIKAVYGATGLRESLRLEDELQKELKAKGNPEPKPGEPPPSLRPYVIVHAMDVDRAVRAIQTAGAGASMNSEGAGSSGGQIPRVIWLVRDRDGAGGVIVIDAQSADSAREALSKLDTGEIQIDGWYSTKALQGLASRIVHATGS